MAPTKGLRILYFSLMGASVIACSSQLNSFPKSQAPNAKGLNPLTIQGPMRRRAQHRATSGSPYFCGGRPAYCLEYNLGDSTTIPIVVYGNNGPKYPYCGTSFNFQAFVTSEIPNQWSATVSPSTYITSPTECVWVTPAFVTLTQNQSYTANGGWFDGRIIFISVSSGLTADSLESWQVTEEPTHPAATPYPTPTPGVDIFDFNLAKVVTGTTQSAIVGQAQILEAVASEPNISLNNCNWTIGGNSVGAYTANGSSPSPEPTGNVQQVQFFWIGSGSNTSSTNETVSVTCSDTSTSNLTASATYNVEQPTVNANVASYYSQMNVFYNGYVGNTGLNIAYAPSSSSYGVNWNYGVSNAPSSGGQIAMGQAVLLNNTAIESASPSPIPTTLGTTNGNYCLDGAFPYAPAVNASKPWISSDAPGSGIANYLLSVSLSFQFKDYFMYMPGKDNLSPSSIWVTLAKATWHASTDGVNNGGALANWALRNNSAGGSQASASSELPTWPCIFNEAPSQLLTTTRRIIRKQTMHPAIRRLPHV